MPESHLLCPKCSGHDFKVTRFPGIVILYWMLNPFLVINELILGQRVPKEEIACKTCEGSPLDRNSLESLIQNSSS